MSATTRLYLLLAARLFGGLAVIGGMFFLAAGTFDYWQGWMYLATLLVPLCGTAAYLLVNDPALLERRMRLREREVTQQKAISVALLVSISAFVIPGLDVRFGWSHVPPWVSVLAAAIMAASYVAIAFVLRANSYASRVVEVEKGQAVISTGPYGVVRHPMYSAAIVFYLASPLALGSWWAIIPAALIIPVLVMRLRNEEDVLTRELPGYDEYRHKVAWRLAPGVY